MQWTSEAIILKQEHYSDDKLLCHIFSLSNGLYKGLVSINKKTRNQIQVGNIINATWKARLPEHLGSFYLELLKPLSMSILNDKVKLTSVISICLILSICLPSRTVESKIYDNLFSYMLSLKDHQNWLIDYIMLELIILQELGYGLNLDICSVTGNNDDLYYVSPKTGNAVSRVVGKDYHDKLFILPEFINNKSQRYSTIDVVNGLKITEFFIENRIFKAINKELPNVRKNFSSYINQI